MSIFNRLCLGTANFGKEYNGVKVSKDEQKRILDYCQCSGIDMIDTAVAYGWDWTKISSYFNVVLKLQKGDFVPNKNLDEKFPYCFMAHKAKDYPWILDETKFLGRRGVSLYQPSEIPNYYRDEAVFQIPYSIFDRRFERYFQEWKRDKVEIHVRSIFLRGKFIEKFKPWECIAFCLMNPFIDRVIIGVDSLQQLKDNLRPFHRMNSAEIHDENVLDPRKWPTTCYDNKGNIVPEKEQNDNP